MQFTLYLVLLIACAMVAPSSAEEAKTEAHEEPPQQQQRTHLRGLLDKLVSPVPMAKPVRELQAAWEDGKVGEARKMLPLNEKIVGGETVVVFNNHHLSPEAKTESAVVDFVVRSQCNCVVSVCGELRNWYMGSKEQCFDLRIAPKSPDALENGLIRGVSAAYSAMRPVARKLYLKFDEANFIDGTPCEYEIVSGSKTVRQEGQPLSGAATA